MMRGWWPDPGMSMFAEKYKADNAFSVLASSSGSNLSFFITSLLFFLRDMANFDWDQQKCFSSFSDFFTE